MRLFGAFQALRMCTQKWHMVNHLPDSIWEAGGVDNLHAKTFEKAHRILKGQQRKTSQKKISAS